MLTPICRERDAREVLTVVRTLRECIRAILEAAISSSIASSEGLALYVNSAQSKNVEYVLYSPKALMDAVEAHVAFSEDDVDPAEALSAVDPHDVVYGYIAVRKNSGKCWNSGEVKYSAARKGYGPLMYELAMSDFARLMPDHGGGSSPSARNVWAKYAERPDVKKLPFDDIANPKTKPTEDDCHVYMDPDGDIGYLNAAYQSKGDKVGKDTLVRSHQALVGQLTASGLKKSDIEIALSQMGDEYFGSRYRENV